MIDKAIEAALIAYHEEHHKLSKERFSASHSAMESAIQAYEAAKWQDISTLKDDGELKLIAFRNKSICIAPSVGRESSKKEKISMIKDRNDWPDFGFNPTHWQHLPTPPKEGE
jgi:uncharacterized membrane protein YvbJ